MAPEPEQVCVVPGALRADAAVWDRAADRLRAAAGGAETEVVLPPAAFSFAGAPVAAAYDALRSRTAGLLRAGADNFDDVATALRRSADAYEADEAAGVARLHGHRSTPTHGEETRSP